MAVLDYYTRRPRDGWTGGLRWNVEAPQARVSNVIMSLCVTLNDMVPDALRGPLIAPVLFDPVGTEAGPNWEDRRRRRLFQWFALTLLPALLEAEPIPSQAALKLYLEHHPLKDDPQPSESSVINLWAGLTERYCSNGGSSLRSRQTLAMRLLYDMGVGQFYGENITLPVTNLVCVLRTASSRSSDALVELMARLVRDEIKHLCAMTPRKRLEPVVDAQKVLSDFGLTEFVEA